MGVTEVGAGVCKPARPQNAAKLPKNDAKILKVKTKSLVIFPANFDVISSRDLEAETGGDDFQLMSEMG